MFKANPLSKSKKIWALGLTIGLLSSFFGLEAFNSNNKALGNQGFLEFQWDQNSTYKKLKYLISYFFCF